jgi:hypothetical protein
MKRVFLIGCSKTKLDHAAQAQHLYRGHLFKLSLAYAQNMAPDAIFILSAKYGLLELDTEIEPYDQTLTKIAQVRSWAEQVVAQLGLLTNLKEDNFIILAGTRYYQFLLPHLPHHEITLGRLRRHERKAWLRSALDHERVRRPSPIA